MNTSLLVLALLAGEAPQGQAGQAGQAGQKSSPKPAAGMPRSVAGPWVIEYIEVAGEPAPAAGAAVSVENNTLALPAIGKDRRAYKLQFKTGHKVEARFTTADPRQNQTGQNQNDRPQAKENLETGVYIVARDFLCFSIGEGHGDTAGYRDGNGKDTPTGPSMVVILRRQGPTIIQSGNVPGAGPQPPQQAPQPQPQRPGESVGAVPAAPGGTVTSPAAGPTGQNGQTPQGGQTGTTSPR